MTLTAEFNKKAKAILIRELGPVDYAQFIQQYEEEPSNGTQKAALTASEHCPATPFSPPSGPLNGCFRSLPQKAIS